MARPQIERPSNGPQQDELDALFEVDHAMDDIFDAIRRDAATESEKTRDPKEVAYGRKHADNSNDVDEEIKITKKRAPIAKLDEKRLLSEAGVPKLQKISKTKFKFRGKGHEFSDVARLLRMYQLWLDDLYPRAKFGDGLTIIEKLGHSRQMQLQRKAWIEEGKPKLPVEDEDPDHDDYQPRSSRPGSKHGGEIARAGTSSSRPSAEPDPGGDEGNGLDRERDGRPKQAGPSHDQSIQSEPDEDELDALLAEEPSEATNRPAPQRPGPATERSFDDDEEAMREMEGMDEL